MRPIIRLGRSEKRVLRRLVKRGGDAGLAQRCRIVLGLSEGVPAQQIQRVLVCSFSTIYRIRARYEEEGIPGLFDRRAGNGSSKIDKPFLSRLIVLVGHCATEFGWRRPTWTREMLVRQLKKDTGISVSVRTLGRAIGMIGARWKRGRPCVLCPWPRRMRENRLRAIRRLIQRLRPDEVAFHEDEVDIHLNPKVGPDWMLPGQQKLVMTPGKNIKRYVAGALDPRTGSIVFVEGVRKTSLLFMSLVERLRQRYASSRKIHLFVDNFCIHSSKKTTRFIESLGGKVQIHFLPPYCPGDNPIEGLWRELHANVTRNHVCKGINELMRNVRRFLRSATPYPRSRFEPRRAG